MSNWIVYQNDSKIDENTILTINALLMRIFNQRSEVEKIIMSNIYKHQHKPNKLIFDQIISDIFSNWEIIKETDPDHIKDQTDLSKLTINKKGRLKWKNKTNHKKFKKIFNIKEKKLQKKLINNKMNQIFTKTQYLMQEAPFKFKENFLPVNNRKQVSFSKLKSLSKNNLSFSQSNCKGSLEDSSKDDGERRKLIQLVLADEEKNLTLNDIKDLEIDTFEIKGKGDHADADNDPMVFDNL